MRSMTRQTRVILAGGLLAIALPAAAQTGPSPAATHLPADILIHGCSPNIVYEVPSVPLRITGTQDTMAREVFAPGDLITINAGTENGMTVGQEFYVRRVEVSRKAKVSRSTPGVVRTAGWIRVYAVDDEMSLATVIYACDAIRAGDYLEPFTPPVVPAPAAERPKPQKSNYGRVLIGNDRRFSFGKGDHFVVDRGSEHGVTPGAHFVIYRNKRVSGNFLVEIAEAVAVTVNADTSTLIVTLSRDAIAVDDYVAIRK